MVTSSFTRYFQGSGTSSLRPLIPQKSGSPPFGPISDSHRDVDTVSLRHNHAIGTSSSMEISIVGINKTRTQTFNLIECTAGASFITLSGTLTEVSLDSVTSPCFSGNKGRGPQTWPFPSPNVALLEKPPQLTRICALDLRG